LRWEPQTFARFSVLDEDVCATSSMQRFSSSKEDTSRGICGLSIAISDRDEREEMGEQSWDWSVANRGRDV